MKFLFNKKAMLSLAAAVGQLALMWLSNKDQENKIADMVKEEVKNQITK